MPRRSKRQDHHAFNDAFELFLLTPAWVGPVFALLAFLLFRYVAPLFFPVKPAGVPDLGILLRDLFPMLGWILAGCLLLVWLGAEATKFFNRFRLDSQTGDDSIRGLSWQAFEELVCEAFRRKGYLAEVVGSASGDGGVDIRLTRGGETALVQCKQWRAFKVGVPTVRELLGVIVAEGANKGILVTSGRFTAEAVRFAHANPQIQLIDGPALTTLIQSVQAQPHVSAIANRSAAPAAATQRRSAEPSPVMRTPTCPLCGSTMVLRQAKRGANAGGTFYGCSRYPACRGIVQSAAAST